MKHDEQLGGEVRRHTLSFTQWKARSPTPRWAGLPLLVGMALTVAACGPGEQPGETLECGPGTEEKNGVCVAIVDPIASCGDGTIFDETTGKCEPTVVCGEGTEVDPDTGECVPSAECGPGTELDLATGECVPVASCGPGTVLDEATGECVSEASCGAGTELVDGECVAVGVCASGSVLNMDTGLCESNTQCGPGQVIVGGACLDPDVAVGLDADATESTPDQNDPDYGGTPESLTLEAAGGQAIFVGNIARPTDFAGDGTLAQDKDTWSFEGAAGQYLEITVIGTGLPQPAFVLEGPNGYRRVSPLLSANEASREVVLPYAGTYRLTVVPTAYLSAALPVGGTTAGYVGVIEELTKPAPYTLIPSLDQAAPTELTGTLRGLSDNFYLLDAGAGAAVSLFFQNIDWATPPAVLAFDASGTLISHLDLEQAGDFEGWSGTLVNDEEGTLLVVDYQSSTAIGDAYTLQVAAIPHVRLEGLVPGASASTAPLEVPGEGLAAFTVDADDAAVIDWGITGSPLVQILGDDPTPAFIFDEDMQYNLLYAAGGSYTFFAYNDSSTPRDAATLTATAYAVHDLGTLDPSTQAESVARGHLLSVSPFGSRTSWAVVRTSEPAEVSLRLDSELGSPELHTYSQTGLKRRADYNTFYGFPIHALVDDQPLLIEVNSGTSIPAIEWSLTASAAPSPEFLDVEPNNLPDVAVDLGALPRAVVGDFDDGDVDVYKLTLPEALAPGKAIEIQLENLATVSSNSDTPALALYDGQNQPLATSPVTLDESNVVTFIHGVEAQANLTFYVEITHSQYDKAYLYRLSARVVDQATDNEPNDSNETADAATALPVTWAGVWTATDTADVYSFNLDESLAFTELLRLRFRDPTSEDAQVVLTNSTGTVLAEGDNDRLDLTVGALTAGQYFISVVSDGPTVYQLTAEVIPLPPIEIEANDAASAATPLGALEPASRLFALGGTNRDDADWLSFTLSAPLASDEGILLQCLNPIDGTTMDCELYDLSDPTSPALLGRVRDDEAAFLTSPASSGPFGVRVVGTATAVDMWYVGLEIGPSGGDAEPNNDVSGARPLGTLAAGDVLAGGGSASSYDDDCFSFTLDAAFPADASVRVTFDNTTNLQDLVAKLYDAADTSVELSYEDDDTGVLITAQTGGGTYAVCISGSSTSSQYSYEFTIDAGPPAELEENDTGATANDLGSLPASIHGVISKTKKDVFKFTLTSDLGPTEVVEVAFENLQDTTDYDISLRPAGDTSRPSQLDDNVGTVRSAAGLTAGTYEIQVDGLDSTTESIALVSDLYRLDVTIVDTSTTP